MPAKPPEDAGQGTEDAKGGVKGRAKPCPICGKPAIETSKPFCSERCRDVDLNRWLSNSYAIPGKPEDDQDAE